MTDLDPRLMDRAKLILQDAPISSEDKAAAWDIYHDSRTAEIFARKITAVSIPDEVKRALLAAKQKSLAPDRKTPIADSGRSTSAPRAFDSRAASDCRQVSC